MSAAEGREIECSRGRTLLTLACAYSRASILSFPAPPVVTDTFRLTSPRTQRILLKTVTVFKGEPIAFIFPLEHQVHVERCADKRRQKAASAATRRPDNNLGFVSTTGPQDSRRLRLHAAILAALPPQHDHGRATGDPQVSTNICLHCCQRGV